MSPWLYYGDTIQVATYPAVIVAAFVAFTFVLRREALRWGHEVRTVMDAALVGIVCGGVLARLLHVVVEAPHVYLADPLRIISPFAGWTYVGGLVGGLLGVRAVARYQGQSGWRLLDLFAMTVPFGQALARMGCLAAGCCYGRVASWPLGVDVPWSVTYHHAGSVPDPFLAVPLHPAPLYLSLMNLSLFVLLAWFRRTDPPPGRTLALFLMSYAVGRGILELFRGDVSRGLWFADLVSTSQLVALCLGTAGAMLWFRSVRATG